MATDTAEFEPRNAKPGQTFRYVAVGTITEGEGDERTTREGVREFTFKADDQGIVRPRNMDEKRAADRHGLTVARKVQQQERSKADETSADKPTNGGEG